MCEVDANDQSIQPETASAILASEDRDGLIVSVGGAMSSDEAHQETYEASENIEIPSSSSSASDVVSNEACPYVAPSKRENTVGTRPPSQRARRAPRKYGDYELY